MFNFLHKPKLMYQQYELSKQIGDISELMAQRKEATKGEREELDTQIEIAQYTLSHMLAKNKKQLRREQ